MRKVLECALETDGFANRLDGFPRYESGLLARSRAGHQAPIVPLEAKEHEFRVWRAEKPGHTRRRRRIGPAGTHIQDAHFIAAGVNHPHLQQAGQKALVGGSLRVTSPSYAECAARRQEADLVRLEFAHLPPGDRGVTLQRPNRHPLCKPPGRAKLVEHDAHAAQQLSYACTRRIPPDDQVIDPAAWPVVAVDELIILKIASEFH
jgi:hypothetical protein